MQTVSPTVSAMTVLSASSRSSAVWINCPGTQVLCPMNRGGVGAQAPVWDVSAKHHIERKKPMPYVNHYSFHILDPEWGHLTIKISGHPPFPAQVILNGHEYVACQARKAGIAFTKEGNCFTTISDAAGLANIAETLSEQRAIGRLSQVCERWIYTCVCFALDFDEQKRSGFHYQYSNYQIEYSRNLVFEVGGHMEQVFQALIDRSRAPLDLKTIKTILGYKHRPKNRRRTKRSAEWEVAVERPTYDLTIFKLHCGKLTLKIYTKGERVLRIEAVAHNTRELNCGRSLDKFPEVVSRLKSVLERFADALSCIDQCFIADEMLGQLPAASRVGKPSSGASISTRRACAASPKRCSLCPPHPTASPPPRWRLGYAHSASKTHYSTVPATLLMI